jgi:hypothetical protein
MPAQETHVAVVTPKLLWDIKHTLQRMVVGCEIPVILHGMLAASMVPKITANSAVPQGQPCVEVI